MKKDHGFDEYVKGLLFGWVGNAFDGKVEILEQKGNKIVFIVTNFNSLLKEHGLINNVTYEEYNRYIEFRHNRVCEFLGDTCSIKITKQGLIVTIQKK